MSESVKNAIRDNLCYYMKEREARNVDLANYVGVSKSAVTKWMSGANSIDIDYVPLICKFLNISLNQLLDDGKLYRFVRLTNEKQELDNIWESLSDDGRQQLLIFARGCVETYRK